MKKTQFLSPHEGVKVGSKLAAMKKIHNFMVPDCTFYIRIYTYDEILRLNLGRIVEMKDTPFGTK